MSINKPKPDVLAVSYRNKVIENIHSGWICVINKKNKIVLKKGNIADYTFLRSIAKPIQAIPLLESNISILPKDLAIICGSHSGSKKHIQHLNYLMKKFNIQSHELLCGVHMPSDLKETNFLIRHNSQPLVIHNNCSGKHIGMLIVCKKNKWNTKHYLNIKHPLQRNILKHLKNLSGVENIKLATDGCGVPTFALPIKNIALLFSRFSKSSNLNYKKIQFAMTKNPFYSGGDNQIDTEIMKTAKKNLVAKVGGAGIIIVTHDGNTAVVKVADGSSQARAKIILDLLIQLKWLSAKEIKSTYLQKILQGNIKNHAGKVVGKIISVF